MSRNEREAPPDHAARQRALDPRRSFLVQAPAGSGKTDLLTRRFLRLLAEVDEPEEIVAITFTNAASAEMRHRILGELEKAAKGSVEASDDEFAMSNLARRALERSTVRGWKLLDLPSRLRISTIDAFCRELALQQPLLSGLGGGLGMAEQPEELYRKAALHTLEQVGRRGTGEAVARLLEWNDNNWQELEELLVGMLGKRDRWMHDFLLSRKADERELREYLERPFTRVARRTLERISGLLDGAPGVREEILRVARLACETTGEKSPHQLAERVELPRTQFPDGMQDALDAYNALAEFLLTQTGTWRSVKGLTKANGFPATDHGRAAKEQFGALVAELDNLEGFRASLASIGSLPPLHYPEADWEIVKACFTLLRDAVGQLKVVFAETASVDFVEVAQIAGAVLRGEEGFPSDAAIAVADGIRHLLVDEFQDTSRRQHELLGRLVAAWSDPSGRTLFAVGDPMQSIYFFRDADAELFGRVREIGLEVPNGEPLELEYVSLAANFRTTPELVDELNGVFEEVFAQDDGSGVGFFPAMPHRTASDAPQHSFNLHFKFLNEDADRNTNVTQEFDDSEELMPAQVREIVDLIVSHAQAVENARLEGRKYSVAVLARAKRSLVPIAAALRKANERAAKEGATGIPFRAIELEKLGMRPEVLDALALGRALLNPEDRVAWLGVLRAPWCGLSLADLHAVAGGDDAALLSRPVADLVVERAEWVSAEGKRILERVMPVLAGAARMRASRPAAVGTWLSEVWKQLGGEACCDATALANLDLLWSCLDKLPGGEPDLLGPGLELALGKLTSLPDPEASSECGVQLMTIHKSKGLEFEVVIVPDLQAKTGGGGRKLLSWLERGLKAEDGRELDDGVTEFLVAPLASKGEESGATKKWVERVYRDRETQETRRVLYVASTRAREELHLFAQLECKADKTGNLQLAKPVGSLLAAAWPGVEERALVQFEEWRAGQIAAETENPSEGKIGEIAAAGNLLVMPTALDAPKGTVIRRLPEGFVPPGGGLGGDWNGKEITGLSAAALYTRHEGGLHSRLMGTAVHRLLEELARLRAEMDWTAALGAIGKFEARVAAEVRAAGMSRTEAADLAAQAMKLARAAAQDVAGAWILGPNAEAASEVCWSGVVDGNVSTVRVDRIFKAGLQPLTEGDEAWWIVDFKTAHADSQDSASSLLHLRPLFAPQIEAYARVLRNLHGASAVVRGGLYYPRMVLLDWWEL